MQNLPDNSEHNALLDLSYTVYIKFMYFQK